MERTMNTIMGGVDGMVLIEKLYFTLKEISGRWQVQMDDLAYMAENGELRVSTRLEGVRLERGMFEFENGRDFNIPYEQAWFSGILDLRRRDAFRVFRDGKARIVHFDACDEEYATVIEPTSSVNVRLKHLVIRRGERDRVEAFHSGAGTSVAESIAFQHTDDFRQIRCGNLRLSLGQIQAKVVRLLHEASQTDDGWRHGKAVLAEAGSNSNRMSDVFKSQPQWRELIESDRYRKYRLRIRMR
jgi:hypothetical protein